MRVGGCVGARGARGTSAPRPRDRPLGWSVQCPVVCTKDVKFTLKERMESSLVQLRLRTD